VKEYDRSQDVAGVTVNWNSPPPDVDVGLGEDVVANVVREVDGEGEEETPADVGMS